jgi:RNA polymerase sigma-70 factor (ECF subfamily)
VGSSARRRAHDVADFATTLEGAQAGYPDDIAVLYETYAPLVLGFMRTSGMANAEDLTGDVFVSMIRALASFHGGEPDFRSWLLTIAYRRRVDELRRMGRRLEDPGLPIDAAEWRAEAGNVEAAALGRLEARGVLDALSMLTDDQRSVLMLRVLADLSVPEICEITGRKEPAVKSSLRRALASVARLTRAPERL